MDGSNVGRQVVVREGLTVGDVVGATVGRGIVGIAEGLQVDTTVGNKDGMREGLTDGPMVGQTEGEDEGIRVGL
jgi:hypothetical protein